jgi:anti-anti-sigma regulatory factor
MKGVSRVFAMLKITSEKNLDSVRLKLEGKLTGPWTNELEREWQTVKSSWVTSLIIDLKEVTFVGEDGKILLKRMWREGAVLIANGCSTGHMVEEITGSQLNA